MDSRVAGMMGGSPSTQSPLRTPPLRRAATERNVRTTGGRRNRSRPAISSRGRRASSGHIRRRSNSTGRARTSRHQSRGRTTTPVPFNLSCYERAASGKVGCRCHQHVEQETYSFTPTLAPYTDKLLDKIRNTDRKKKGLPPLPRSASSRSRRRHRHNEHSHDDHHHHHHHDHDHEHHEHDDVVQLDEENVPTQENKENLGQPSPFPWKPPAVVVDPDAAARSPVRSPLGALPSPVNTPTSETRTIGPSLDKQRSPVVSLPLQKLDSPDVVNDENYPHVRHKLDFSPAGPTEAKAILLTAVGNTSPSTLQSQLLSNPKKLDLPEPHTIQLSKAPGVGGQKLKEQVVLNLQGQVAKTVRVQQSKQMKSELVHNAGASGSNPGSDSSSRSPIGSQSEWVERPVPGDANTLHAPGHARDFDLESLSSQEPAQQPLLFEDQPEHVPVQIGDAVARSAPEPLTAPMTKVAQPATELPLVVEKLSHDHQAVVLQPTQNATPSEAKEARTRMVRDGRYAGQSMLVDGQPQHEQQARGPRTPAIVNAKQISLQDLPPLPEPFESSLLFQGHADASHAAASSASPGQRGMSRNVVSTPIDLGNSNSVMHFNNQPGSTPSPSHPHTRGSKAGTPSPAGSAKPSSRRQSTSPSTRVISTPVQISDVEAHAPVTVGSSSSSPAVQPSTVLLTSADSVSSPLQSTMVTGVGKDNDAVSSDKPGVTGLPLHMHSVSPPQQVHAGSPSTQTPQARTMQQTPVDVDDNMPFGSPRMVISEFVKAQSSRDPSPAVSGHNASNAPTPKVPATRESPQGMRLSFSPGDVPTPLQVGSSASPGAPTPLQTHVLHQDHMHTPMQSYIVSGGGASPDYTPIQADPASRHTASGRSRHKKKKSSDSGSKGRKSSRRQSPMPLTGSPVVGQQRTGAAAVDRSHPVPVDDPFAAASQPLRIEDLSTGDALTFPSSSPGSAAHQARTVGVDQGLYGAQPELIHNQHGYHHPHQQQEEQPHSRGLPVSHGSASSPAPVEFGSPDQRRLSTASSFETVTAASSAGPSGQLVARKNSAKRRRRSKHKQLVRVGGASHAARSLSVQQKHHMSLYGSEGRADQHKQIVPSRGRSRSSRALQPGNQTTNNIVYLTDPRRSRFELMGWLVLGVAVAWFCIQYLGGREEDFISKYV